MNDSKSGFLEDKVDPVPVRRETNKFVLSLIPFEQTTTYIKGTREAPEAIIEASAHMEVMDESLGIDITEHGIITRRPNITDLKSITSYVSQARRDFPEAFQGFLGGEHSITPAIIEGLQPESIGIVWIDAHADLRRSFGGQPDNHACAGFNSVPFGRIVQVGVRTLAPEEAEFLNDTDRVRTFRHWDSNAAAAIRELPDTIYLSIDVDGLSPMLMRAVGTPEPGGLMWEEMVELLDFLFQEKEVLAFDVVELCPQPGDVVSTFTAAKLVHKVMACHALYKLSDGRARPLL
jgi:agmatinase